MALRVGDYVEQTRHPEWGIGRVVSLGESEKIKVFFLRGLQQLFRLGTDRRLSSNLEIAGSAKWDHADRNLYVVELNPKIYQRERRFVEANLHWISGKHLSMSE